MKTESKNNLDYLIQQYHAFRVLGDTKSADIVVKKIMKECESPKPLDDMIDLIEKVGDV